MAALLVIGALTAGVVVAICGLLWYWPRWRHQLEMRKRGKP
jgi:hypothetical protein